jgi:hypothetical protein
MTTMPTRVSSQEFDCGEPAEVDLFGAASVVAQVEQPIVSGNEHTLECPVDQSDTCVAASQHLNRGNRVEVEILNGGSFVVYDERPNEHSRTDGFGAADAIERLDVCRAVARDYSNRKASGRLARVRERAPGPFR